jgi:hypothetical protein
VDRYAKLSPTQVRVLRNVRTHTVNGVTTYRVSAERGDKQATFLRLYRLGLLAAPHEYSDLTSLGMDAMNQLNDSPETDRVPVGQAGGKRWEEQAPKSPAVAVAPAGDATVARYRAVANGFDFAVEDRTDGTFVATGISSLYAARDLAERRNADADPITAADLADGELFSTVPTVVEMAAAGRFIPLTGGADPVSLPLMNRIRGLAFMDEIRKLWADGTRVRGVIGGIELAGAVRLGNESWVRSSEDPDFGRAYVFVAWDAAPDAGRLAMYSGFPVDKLTRLQSEAEDAPLMTQQIPALTVLPSPAEMAAAGRFVPLTGGTDPASQALMNRIRGLAFQDELRKLWTDDTRVRHQDGRTGNVIAGDTSWVQLPDHTNYGRAYTGVMWDRTPETHVEAAWRGRPFTDQLTRI